jgi:protein-disulfide isomerase
MGGLAAAAVLRLWNADQCTSLDEARRTRLISFVRTKYNLPSNADIGVADGGTVFGSCFRKLVFASLSGRPFRAELFASPDFRFLTNELLDARPDPKETLQLRRQTAADLVRGNLPVRGSEKAPVTLAVFSDFQCPYCARMAKTVNDLAASHGDGLRIVYHYFPLAIHKWARSAAIAAACAQRQNNPAFWSLHDYLFAHQRDLSPDNLRARITEWARTAPNLDQESFEMCVSKELTSGQVDQDMALGEELGVHATPTLFLNGEPLDASSPDELRALIARAAAAHR